MSQSQSLRQSKPIPEAPESNAGDDFHLLWAARKALELLDPNGTLKALSIEGPAPEDAIIDRDGDQLLGIDLAEYYEGEDFNSSSQVIYSQLKYSTRRAQDSWTASQLCQGKKRGTAGSIVHRLAQVFAAHLKKFDRDTVLSRLRLKLVSNRPISNAFAKALEEAQAALRNISTEVRRNDLFKKLSPIARMELEKLNRAAGLQSSQFTDFLRVLDVFDCGTGSRLQQNIELVKAIGKHGAFEVPRQYNALKALVLDRMMPEKRQVPPLTVHDIVPIFGLSSYDNAFPAKVRLESLDNPIERLQLQEITKTILEGENGPICLHAGAGCGKTTVIRSLHRYLPESSAVVLFDCYGGGSYLNPSEVRHGHRRAILQIANEIAVQTGSPLLLSADLPPEDLLRALIERLKIAADLLRAKSPQAL